MSIDSIIADSLLPATHLLLKQILKRKAHDYTLALLVLHLVACPFICLISGDYFLFLFGMILYTTFYCFKPRSCNIKCVTLKPYLIMY